MSLPTLNDYHLAVQNPNHSFSDPNLRSATVETTALGMPKARSGGFAVTYRLNGNGESWAVRCFHRATPDLQSRYADISRFLGQKKPERFLEFGYQPDGINVNGTWFPIVKMVWKSATPLDTYLDKHHSDPNAVRALKEEFVAAVSALEQIGVAHGDLQHGNMLVDVNRITFVDYDGMYVPGMAATTSNERGHVNYQSPLRTGNDFGPHLDRFSAMAITLSLEALEHRPDLLNKYGLRDNLIFTAKDFVEPNISPVLQELQQIPALRSRVDQFVLACRTPLHQLPTLSDFLGGANRLVASQAVAKVSTRTHLYQYPVIDALHDVRLRELTGEVAQVVGYVTDVTTRWARYGQPYAFVNFSDWHDKRFRIVVWNEVLKEFQAIGADITDLESMWITLVGLVQDFQGIPQIIPESMRDFRVLAGGEREARDMLAAASSSVSLPALTQARSRNAQVLQSLKTKPTDARSEPVTSSAGKPPQTTSQAGPQQVPVRKSNRDIIASLLQPSEPNTIQTAQSSISSTPTPPSPPQAVPVQPPPPYVAPKSFGNSAAGCIIPLLILIAIVLLMLW